MCIMSYNCIRSQKGSGFAPKDKFVGLKKGKYLACACRLYGRVAYWEGKTFLPIYSSGFQVASNVKSFDSFLSYFVLPAFLCVQDYEYWYRSESTDILDLWKTMQSTLRLDLVLCYFFILSRPFFLIPSPCHFSSLSGEFW